MMAIGQGHGPGAGDAIRRQRPGNRSLENPEVFLRDAVERAYRHVEIFGENFFRSMCHPIGEQEGLLLGEVAVVKDEQELAAVALDSLDRVRDACRKIPEVTLADVLLKGASVLVNG